MGMKKYYKECLGATGYRINEKFHGLALTHRNTECYYIDYKNKAIFYFTSIIKTTFNL